MIKLVDYFVVVGYDESVDGHQKQSSFTGELNSFQENLADDGGNKASSEENGKVSARGKIIQRFPIPSDNEDSRNMDSDDYQEFDNNIHCFCQPDKGWRLYNKQEPPNFFVSVLTDIKVNEY